MLPKFRSVKMPKTTAALIAVFLFILVFPMSGVLADGAGGGPPAKKPDPERITFYMTGWQIYKGDRPVSESDWRPLDRSMARSMKHYQGSVWLRRTLPELSQRDPYLFLQGIKRAEVRVDGKPVYSFNMDHSRKYITEWVFLSIPLKPDDAGKQMLIHSIWDHSPLRSSWNIIGPREELSQNVLRSSWTLQVYSTLLITAGLVSAALFVRRRKEPMYGWLALFGLSAGIGILLLDTDLVGKLEYLEWIYWRDLLLPVGIYAFVGFFGAALGGRFGTSYKWAKRLLLLFTVMTAVMGIVHSYLYTRLLVEVLPYFFFSAFGIVTFTLFRQYRSDRSRQTVWLVRGYAVLLASCSIHILNNVTGALPEFIARKWVFVYRILFEILPHGLMAFTLCLIMVVYERITEVYRQSAAYAAELAEFQLSLEDLVRQRTRELEEANTALAGSVRETAEALTEVSVLEERNRIAHEIHDVVGHTLTAAVVQLEAAKKLADRGIPQTVDKIAVVQDLVRKGLDDIRRSVRLLKDESGPLELGAALRELVRETEDAAGVRIDAYIHPLPPLSGLTQRVLYHALQEGLTNGIRHGRCTFFTFELFADGEQLHFKLANDGEPYLDARPGFGLTAMMERVHLLGGTVHIGPAAGLAADGMAAGLAADGTTGTAATGTTAEAFSGCRLEIELPLPRG
ncbi:sensor histidine kinase [Paenibacillus gansuensis]|uniref:histidine kinase n=1 Tax=Paenibacillus gansuensis TaxID=306542 RepID=A0ABW5PJL9_9BACL